MAGRRRRPDRTTNGVHRTVRAASAALVLALGVGGCAGAEQSGSPAHRVSTWIDGGGGSGIGNVEVATRNVDLAIATHNKPSAVRLVCSLLSNEAQTSIGNLPSPDDQLTAKLNLAYEVATAAGDDCYRGAAGSPQLMARSATERARTLTLLGAAVDYVRSVTGHTPTTETTAPQGNSDPFGGGS